MKRAYLNQNLSGVDQSGLYRISNKIRIILAVMIFVSTACTAQQSVVSVHATSRDISNNLDLKAVASLFGESSNMQEFERKLNDYNTGISNLDLNNDGQIDYLRVVENMENNMHVIVIQAVLDRNVYQDVATINVEQQDTYRTRVYVVGAPYLYGVNYVIEPTYVYTPPIFSFFRSYNYRCWVSPYSYGYYPVYYHYRRPVEINLYFSNVRRYINNDHRYYYAPDYRCNDRFNYIRNTISRNDYADRHPEYTFSRRNVNITNYYELDSRRNNYNNNDRSRYNRNDNRYDSRSGNNSTMQRSNSSNQNNEGWHNNRRGNDDDDVYTNRNNRYSGSPSSNGGRGNNASSGEGRYSGAPASNGNYNNSGTPSSNGNSYTPSRSESNSSNQNRQSNESRERSGNTNNSYRRSENASRANAPSSSENNRKQEAPAQQPSRSSEDRNNGNGRR